MIKANHKTGFNSRTRCHFHSLYSWIKNATLAMWINEWNMKWDTTTLSLDSSSLNLSWRLISFHIHVIVDDFDLSTKIEFLYKVFLCLVLPTPLQWHLFEGLIKKIEIQERGKEYLTCIIIRIYIFPMQQNTF